MNRPFALRLFLGAVIAVAPAVLSADRGSTTEVPPLEIITQPYYHTKHHDLTGGYRNIWPKNDYSTWRAVGWLAGKGFESGKDYKGIPHQSIDANDLRNAAAPRRFRVHWLGQATAYIVLRSGRAGERPTTVLTDPIFGNRASPVSFAGPQRLVPLAVDLEDLPYVDAVVISHDHYDHLDVESVDGLEQHHRPRYFVPLGVDQRLRSFGVPASRITAMDWNQYADFRDLRVHCTPARHFSGRSGVDRNSTLWASWMIEQRLTSGNDALRFYFAGDTGYSDHFTKIRERLGAPDVALIPIGAYTPRWFMREVHVDPPEAVQAFLDLQGKHMIGIHWGTFDLADEPILEPLELTPQLAQERGASGVHVLPVGGMIEE